VNNANDLKDPLALAFQAGRYDAVRTIEREAKAMREKKP